MRRKKIELPPNSQILHEGGIYTAVTIIPGDPMAVIVASAFTRRGVIKRVIRNAEANDE